MSEELQLSDRNHENHMHPVPINKVSQEFTDCWVAAIQHIATRVDPNTIFFIKQDLTPPFLEHISFRLGNQIFCVHVCDQDQELVVPSESQATIVASEKSNGIPCKIVMQATSDGWIPRTSDWGLTHLITGELVNPEDLVTGELIEMSEWEQQDFAIQIVRHVLEQKGHKIRSWVPDPGINPQIWFIDPEGRDHFVVVRWVKYPDIHAVVPHNIGEIMEACALESNSGFFTSVVIANPVNKIINPENLNLLDPNTEEIEVQPLWRGADLLVDLTDLIPLQKVMIQ